ncbi:serine/arginine repetitive matrix protein 2 [Drosophila subpulchrella]|uniref:serine/arginine repetitive matrix protein 2 n=1 Tax=Drosophila subpulchrella TaxID=1486046 RepID=UPI0018A1AEE9|nr:serine/arginine repetitive matrix protein 2 [Drosophila subpulchrella]
MSHDMTQFLGGVRRTPQDRARTTRTKVGTGLIATVVDRSGAATARSTQRPPNGGGAAHQPRWNQRPPVGATAAAGVAPKRPVNRVRPQPGVTAEPGGAVPKRATGGGATRVIQTTATSTLRRRQVPPPPPRLTIPRRTNEIKWIMKPSLCFVPCSESSSEDNIADKSDIPHEGDDELATKVDKTRSSRRLTAEHVGQAKNKVRSSRMFRVPSQRIMRVEELKQAQLQQMHPRKTRTQNQTHSSSLSRSRSPNWSASRSPSPLPHQSPSRYPGSPSSRPVIQPNPSRLPSDDEEQQQQQQQQQQLKDVPLEASRPVTQLPEPTSGLISCSPSPIASPFPSQSRLQSPSISGTCWNSSCCTMETCVKSSTSSSTQYSTPSSTNSSSLSTSGSECRGGHTMPVTKRLSRPVRMATGRWGTKAIKLTSTVIEIIKPATSTEAKRFPEAPRKKEVAAPLQAKINSAFKPKGQAETRQAMNAPMVQSIAPPKFTPKVQVPNPISQSVNHVVNQLTAQLKEAAMVQSKDEHKQPREQALKDQDVYQSWTSKAPSRKPSFYLLMNQPENQPETSSNEPSKDAWVIQPMEQPTDTFINLYSNPPRDQTWKQHTNHYLDESKDHPRLHSSRYMNPSKVSAVNQQINESIGQAGRHLMSLSANPPKYTIPPKNWEKNPSQSQLNSLIPQSRVSKNPYIGESNRLSKLQVKTQRTPSRVKSPPVSLNRINRPSTSTGSPYVVPPSPPQPQQQQQQSEGPTASKIVRKTQHKVPRTMEDGIDMSYQYFVSIPLKRGKKPQVVRYLYRPMVRQLNAPTSPNRRNSRRSKKKAAAAGGDEPPAAEDGSQQMDPDLKALGGMPLPLEDPPRAPEKSPEPEGKSKILLDPEEVLNAPYEVPPLKLDARFKSMMEQLAQMPYPEERTNRRLRRSNRRARAAGGADQVPPSEQHVGTGGGDAVRNEMRSLEQVSSIWKSGSRRPKLINYRPEADRLSTASGAPISYHTPVQISEVDSGHFVLPVEPMIQAITYDDIDRKERDQLEEQQLPLETEAEALPLEKPQEGATVMIKSVSFDPGDVKVSEIPARSSSSISISSTSSSSCGRTKTKGRRTLRKSKAKGKAKIRR